MKKPKRNTDKAKKDKERVKKATGEDGKAERKKKLDNLKNDRPNCFKQLNILRGNALCLRTSGEAPAFYNADTQQYYVNNETCKTIVPACAKTFAAIQKFNQIVIAAIQCK